MKIKEFKKYCIQKQKELESEIKRVRDSLANLPSPSNITLPEGEKLLQLESRYRATNRLTIRQRLLGISSSDLQEFIIKEKERNLQKKAKRLESQISELKAITNNQDNTIYTIPSKNGHIIITLLDYCLDHKFTSSDTLNYLLEFFKCATKEEQVILSSYERDILSHFNSNGQINPNNIHSVLFIFDKLFNHIIPENQHKYNELIADLKIEIENRSSLVYNHHDEKQELLTQKDAITQLQEYIENGTVVVTATNITDFTNLLKIAKIPALESQKYITQMQALIEKERTERDLNLVEKELSPGEFKMFLSAQQLAPSVNQEQSIILTRLIKDIISLCRYLNIGIPPEERTLTIELLSTKVHLLVEAAKMIENPVPEQSAYRYIVGEDGIPTIIRNIESIDPLYYPNLYNKLVTIPIEEQSLPAFTIDGIDFYIEQTQEVSIVYTIVNKKRVLTYATVQKDVNEIRGNIPLNSISAIKEMQKFPEENHELEQNYENLLIKLLDLYDGIQNKTLKK